MQNALQCALRCTTLSDMSAQLTIRLPEELKEALEAAAQRMERNSSQIVRLALEAYLQSGPARGQRPADRVRGLIGSLESGLPDLAERHREYVLDIPRLEESLELLVT